MNVYSSFSELACAQPTFSVSAHVSNTLEGFNAAKAKTESFRRALPKSGENRMSGTLKRRIETAFAELTDGTIPDIKEQRNLWEEYIRALEQYEQSDNNLRDVQRALDAGDPNAFVNVYSEYAKKLKRKLYVTKI